MLQLALLNMAFWVGILATGSAGAALVVRTWLRNRHALTDEEVRRLMNTLDEMQQTLEDIRTEGELARRKVAERFGEVSGRVEFVERLLAEGKPTRD